MSRAFASLVSVPPFYCSNGEVWVEVDHNRHSRCDSRRLHELLTYVDPGPAYTLKGKLRLQLYGLRPLKSKEAAKRELLRALEASNRSLKVPEDVRKIEIKLCKEYHVKNVAAEKEYREREVRRKEAEDQARRKRKRDEDALRAEIQAEFDTERTYSEQTRPLKKPKKTATAKPLTFQDLAGVYRITAPALSDNWDCGPLSLRLAPSSTSDHLWGSFEFDVVEGTLRSATSLQSEDNSIKFHWRGHETGEGESTFGDNNIAVFQFLGNGKVTGTMYWDCLGNFELLGRLNLEVSLKKSDFARAVLAWKNDYRKLTKANYARESRSRWGGSGWGYDEDERMEPCSDTDAPNEGGDDSEEEDGEVEEKYGESYDDYYATRLF